LSKRPDVFIQDNPGKPKTSWKRAAEFVERGLARWVEVGSPTIRFYPESERWASARQDAEMAKDAAYWDGVLRERGGTVEVDELGYEMRVARSFPSGMAGVEFWPCIVAKRR
jgi:hypothetical protein